MAQAVTHYNNPKKLAELSEDLGEAMFGTPVSDIKHKWHLDKCPTSEINLWLFYVRGQQMNASLGVNSTWSVLKWQRID